MENESTPGNSGETEPRRGHFDLPDVFSDLPLPFVIALVVVYAAYRVLKFLSRAEIEELRVEQAPRPAVDNPPRERLEHEMTSM